MPAPCNVVVLLSGKGSNLQALIDDVARAPGNARLRAVISNRDDAAGLVRAREAGIEARVLPSRPYPDRQAYDAALIALIDEFQADLVVLAGFMRILSGTFVSHYAGRLLNIHPSLLPRHKGLDTHVRVLEAGDSEHGCSVHFVTEELDGGPLVIQAAIDIGPDDTAETLAQRVHAQEHQIYPLAVRWFADGRLRLTAEGVMLDGQLIPSPGRSIRYSGDL